MEHETWKQIPGFDGYEASSEGRIRSSLLCPSAPRVLKPAKSRANKWSYQRVNIRHKGKTLCCLVHRLVALTFLGLCPDGMEVCHKDGNRDNNKIENLRYDTHSSNMRESSAYLEKISAQEVTQLRSDCMAGRYNSVQEIAAYYSVRPSYISAILHGHARKDIPGDLLETRFGTRVTDEMIADILLDRRNGESLSQIAEKYRVSSSYVSLVVRGLRRVRKA